MFKDRSVRIMLLVCALVGVVSFACQAQTGMQPGTSQEVREFYRIARSEIEHDEQCRSAVAYLQKLSVRKQSEIAHAIVGDPDARLAYLGANWLITHGRINEAIPALASIIATGRDQTQLKGRFGYEWVHGDEEKFLQVLISLSQFLLSRLDDFKTEDRSRVEQFLMGGLFKPPTEPFSVEAARRRLTEMETALRKLKRNGR